MNPVMPPRRFRYLELLTLVLLGYRWAQASLSQIFCSRSRPGLASYNRRLGSSPTQQSLIPDSLPGPRLTILFQLHSWGYKILLSLAHARFGIVGIGVFGVIAYPGCPYA